MGQIVDGLTNEDLREMRHIHYGRKRSVYIDQFFGGCDLESGHGTGPEAQIQDAHSEYLAYCNGRRILLRRIEDGKMWSLPYVVRGTATYKTKTHNRMLDIASDWRNHKNWQKAMFITIAPRAVGSQWQIHKQVKFYWSAFMDWLRKRFLIGNYMWAMEPTQRHYSHYHLVVQGRHPKGLMAQEILSWWKSKGMDIEDPGVDVQYSRKDPSTYAMKYVAKGTGDKLWSSMLWLTGGRIWGVSRGLGRGEGRLSQNENPEWECLGSVSNLYIDEILSGRLAYEDIGSINWHLMNT